MLMISSLNHVKSTMAMPLKCCTTLADIAESDISLQPFIFVAKCCYGDRLYETITNMS